MCVLVEAALTRASFAHGEEGSFSDGSPGSCRALHGRDARSIVTYGELGKAIGIDGVALRNEMRHILVDLSDDCQARGEPSLAELVVNRPLGAPGPGWRMALDRAPDVQRYSDTGADASCARSALRERALGCWCRRAPDPGSRSALHARTIVGRRVWGHDERAGQPPYAAARSLGVHPASSSRITLAILLSIRSLRLRVVGVPRSPRWPS